MLKVYHYYGRGNYVKRNNSKTYVFGKLISVARSLARYSIWNLEDRRYILKQSESIRKDVSVLEQNLAPLQKQTAKDVVTAIARCWISKHKCEQARADFDSLEG